MWLLGRQVYCWRALRLAMAAAFKPAQQVQVNVLHCPLRCPLRCWHIPLLEPSASGESSLQPVR